MNVDHLSRQLSLIPMDTLGVTVNVVGCGAIGSFCVLSLAKMGITNIKVWDFDTVSVENMSNQFYRFSDIDKFKALALRELVEDFTNVSIDARITALESLEGLDGIVVVAVDSMAARSKLFASAKNSVNTIKLFIDPRMGAESFSMYTMVPSSAEDTKTYTKTLHTDAEAAPAPCTAKSTVYTATLAAGLIVKCIKNYILKEAYPRVTQWNIKASSQPMDMYPSVTASVPDDSPAFQGAVETPNVANWTYRSTEIPF